MSSRKLESKVIRIEYLPLESNKNMRATSEEEIFCASSEAVDYDTFVDTLSSIQCVIKEKREVKIIYVKVSIIYIYEYMNEEDKEDFSARDILVFSNEYYIEKFGLLKLIKDLANLLDKFNKDNHRYYDEDKDYKLS